MLRLPTRFQRSNGSVAKLFSFQTKILNFKITYPRDLALAEFVLNNELAAAN